MTGHYDDDVTTILSDSDDERSRQAHRTDRLRYDDEPDTMTLEEYRRVRA